MKWFIIAAHMTVVPTIHVYGPYVDFSTCELGMIARFGTLDDHPDNTMIICSDNPSGMTINGSRPKVPRKGTPHE